MGRSGRVASDRAFINDINPRVSSYNGGLTPQQQQQILSNVRGATPHFLTQAPNTHYLDSSAADALRMKDETMEEVGKNRVIYTTNLEKEQRFLEEQRDRMEQEKYEQYEWDQADPGQPWTMQIMRQNNPELIESRNDLIRKTAQLMADVLTVKHLGHNLSLIHI
jgi:hypothetical protein